MNARLSCYFPFDPIPKSSLISEARHCPSTTVVAHRCVRRRPHSWRPVEEILKLLRGPHLATKRMRFVKPYQLFLNMVKETKGKQGRLLGLDVGDKYVGIAVSEPDNKVAFPLSVLVRTKTNIDLMASDFNELISKLSLKGFVVGACLNRQRAHSEAVKVKAFVDDLCRTGKLEGLQFTYWNESYSSKNVELFLKDLHLDPVIYKSILDKFAAVVILQGYLDSVDRKMKQEAKEELFK